MDSAILQMVFKSVIVVARWDEILFWKTTNLFNNCRFLNGIHITAIKLPNFVLHHFISKQLSLNRFGLTLTTVYPKKYAHGFCFAVLCCRYTLTDFPISIRLTSLALWQSNDCPSASKATLVNMDKYFMWIHDERLHNHNKAKHNKTVCIFLGIYCWWVRRIHGNSHYDFVMGPDSI